MRKAPPSKVVDGVAHRHTIGTFAAVCTPAQAVAELIKAYALHPDEADVSVGEVLKNLRILKRKIASLKK